MKNSEKTLEMIVNLCKNRGFVYAGSEIYGGLANSWDYGPLGVEFKNNVKKAWLKKYVSFWIWAAPEIWYLCRGSDIRRSLIIFKVIYLWRKLFTSLNVIPDILLKDSSLGFAENEMCVG